MVSEEVPAWLACAQCEIASATLECIDEELLYCAPCSASLHSKRARLHHSVKPFQTCDECEAAVARMQCVSCAGRQSKPLVFCVDCSTLLHSKKARQHHQVDSISSSCRQEGVLQNEFKDAKKEEAIHTTAETAITEEAVALTSRQGVTPDACLWFETFSGEQGFSRSREEQGPPLHSNQGSSQSKQDSLLTNTRDASKQVNTHKKETQLTDYLNAHEERDTQKAAFNTRGEDVRKDHLLQGEDTLTNASQEAGIVHRLDASKDSSIKQATLIAIEAVLTGTEAVVTGTEVNGVSFTMKAGPGNMQEAVTSRIEEFPIGMAHVPPKAQGAPLSSTSGVAPVWTEQATLANTQEAIPNRAHTLLGSAEGVPNMGIVAPTFTQKVPLFSVREALLSSQHHNGHSSSTEEAANINILNVSKEAQLVGSRQGMAQSLSQIHFVQPSFQSNCTQPTPDNGHSHSPFHTQSSCQSHYQGPRTPPPFQNHLFPHCTPGIPKHLAASMWPVRTMDFSHSAFHGNQYNAGFMTPACQSYALVSPPGYMPYSNPYYTGFIHQVDHSSSADTPQRLYEHSQPMFAHENSDCIHSKSEDRQGPGSNKRLCSNLYEVNPKPTSDIGEETIVGNLSKKLHVGEGLTKANSPNQVNGEGTARPPLKNVHVDIVPEELSKKVEEACMQGTSFLEKEHTSSSPGEAISEKDSQGKSFEKALLTKEVPCNKLPNAFPSMANGVPPEMPYGEAFMPEGLLEKVSATETCGKVSETVTCSSGAASEQLPNVLIPGMQLDDCLLSKTPIIVLTKKSAPRASGSLGEVMNEKLAVEIDPMSNKDVPSPSMALDDCVPRKKLAVEPMSNEVVPSPIMSLDDCVPMKEPITGVLDKVIPVAYGPIGEVRNEELVCESLSSEVLSEMATAGTLPVRAPPKVPLANVSPKEEPVDLMPGGDELSEFAADTFVAGEDSPRIGWKSNMPGGDSDEIKPKEECVLRKSTKRLKKVTTSSPLQVTQNPLPDTSKEEENSRESSEPSYSEEDTSADDKTFNTKKYRRGTITLEATVMKEIVHDASNAIIERIRIMLRRGLCCGTSDEDARQALKTAQRQLTKYNLKQASASEGRLQNSQALKTGSCVVEFVSTGSSQRGRLDCWTYNLAQNVAKYFATEFCAQKLKVVFYGITQNAYCAGHAFAAAFNRVATFSAEYIPEKMLDEGDLVEIDRNWECPNKGVFSRKSRLAYKNDLIEALFKIPKWQRERRAVKAERVEIGDDVIRVPTHSVWMEGVPKNASLVKKHGYETIEALMIYCRKACKAFIEKNKWTIVSSKLKDPILW